MNDSIVGTEYLPNVHIEKIAYQKTADEEYKTVTTISMYDYSTRTWSLDDKFTSYLNVYHINVMSKVSIEQITLGQRMLSEFNNNTKKVINFNQMDKSEVTIRGKDYVKFKTTVESSAFLQSSGDLAVFCASFIDLEQLKQNENLNLSYFAKQSYMGVLKSEKIIQDGEEITNTFVFRDEDGVPWSGPVHLMANDTDQTPTIRRYMAGSQHGDGVEKFLSRDTIDNTNKIYYLLPIIIPPFGQSNPNRPSTPGAAPSYPAHQQEFVEDVSRNLSNTVVTDVASVALQESNVASIMNQYYPEKFTEICDTTNIQNIEVYRYPISISRGTSRVGLPILRPDLSQPTLIAKSNNNKQKVKNKTLFKISPTEIVSVDPTTLGNNSRTLFFNGRNLTLDMLKNAPKIGTIEQNNLTLPSSLRPITFTDYDIKNAKEGRYRYGVKLSIQDQHFLYCKQLLKDLLMHQNRIQNLHNILIIKNVFNGDEFDIQFLQEFYSQYNITIDTETGFVDGEFMTEALQNSYLVKSFELFNEAERLVGMPPRANTMINNLNLFSSNLDNILNTADYFAMVIDRFKETYDLSDGESYEKSSSKSRKDRGVIEKNNNIKK